MEYLAKPSGISLKEHVENLLEELDALFHMLPYTFKKYHLITGQDLYKYLCISCQLHDTGKKNPIWQSACQKDYFTFRKWLNYNSGKTWRDYKKSKNGNVGNNLRSVGIRHEMYSLIYNHKKLYGAGGDNYLPIKIAIAAHHGKLNHRFIEKRWEKEADKQLPINGKDIVKDFIKYEREFAPHTGSIDFELLVKEVYKVTGVRSYLVLMDHWASAKEEEDEVLPVTKFEYSFNNEWTKRPVQKIAEQQWSNDILLLRAPTGAGKTDACLLWAKKQIDNSRAERLIIAMPTRFTSNALELDISKSVSDTGLYHSTSLFNKFSDPKDSHNKKLHKFSRYLLSSTTVCTIDHLLMLLTLTREDHHISMFNLANSCVVIDEADFYDEFTQANLIQLLKTLKALKVPVMLMSASLPKSFLKLYKQAGFNSPKIFEDVSNADTSKCHLKQVLNYSNLDEIEDLLNLCIERGNAIIYVNTVAKAFQYYEWFIKRNVLPIIYHSRFTEPHKKEKENELIEHLGKQAWKDGTSNGIAILTQIGEMSVNISSEIMISEICPVDRLVQRIGRLQRFNRTDIGALHVLVPIKNEQIYPAPYGELKEEGWVASPALERTLNLLSSKTYTNKELSQLINIIYDKIDLSQNAIQNAKKLDELFSNNWLIGSIEITKEDDSSTAIWKSRNIDDGITVFTEFPSVDNFQYYTDFLDYKLTYGIDVFPYLVQKGKKNGSLLSKEIVLHDEKKTIYIAANKDVYNPKCGLQLDKGADVFL